jgi:O-acetyl-ADP-ribose deacetylase (regulator of RNase III)
MNQVIRESELSHSCKFQIVQGDITIEDVDAIVNAANSQLIHGGGVAGIISRKGGPAIQQESDAWVREHGPVSHAEPAFTSGGRLPCKYIIHAVGPIWGSGNEDSKLAKAVTGSLKVADSLDLNSITFPAISTGIFGFPKKRAARIIFKVIDQYISNNHQSGIKLIRLVLFDKATLDPFLQIWDEDLEDILTLNN